MDARVGGFDWDSANREKCQLHGVSITEIESIFGNPVAVVPDPMYSRGEERFKAIGGTTEGRLIFVVFVLRRRADPADQRPLHAPHGDRAL